MDGWEAISLVETDLRALIKEVLGDGWLAMSRCDPARLEAKRTEESKKRPGGSIESDLLVYTEFYELGEIIVGNWSHFGLFGNERGLTIPGA